MDNPTNLKIFTDGAARGNPGPAGAGWVFFSDDEEEKASGFKYLGEATNNQAEYQALLLALKDALEFKLEGIQVFSDSELMVRQINGEYKVKNPDLKPLYQEVKTLLSQFPSYQVNHVRRENNSRADELANQAIDSAS